MLSLEEGIKATQFARENVELYVKHRITATRDLGKPFTEKRGVFVTIHTYPSNDLRGCIGIPEPVLPLQEALISSAKSATEDPRFNPMQEGELDKVLIEITVLTKPELLKVDNPKDYPSKIEIGRDGLIVEQGVYRGLLLPQVPIEQGWNEEDFLSHACMKAGLPPDAWFDTMSKIYRFSGQIFSEVEPRGKVREKNLDGSNH